MRIVLTLILTILLAIHSKAQIQIDTLLSYSSAFSVAVMECDSNGDIIVAGSSGSNAAMAKINPEDGLVFHYRYESEFLKNKTKHISKVTFDENQNIYAHLFAEHNNSWIEKFNPNGLELNKFDSLECTWLGSNPDVEYGNLRILENGTVELISQSKSNDVVKYIFDNELKEMVKSDTFQIESDIYCCFNSFNLSNGETVFPANVNDIQGLYKLNTDMDFVPFQNHSFIDDNFILLSNSENEMFGYNNNVVYPGGDTFVVMNPSITRFSSSLEGVSSSNPFEEIIESANTVVRPYFRDMLVHEEYGIIGVGQFSNDNTNPMRVTQFIAQINPYTLELEDILINDTSRIFWKVQAFNDKVYSIDIPSGYPSGFNLFELTFNEITSTKIIEGKKEELEIYPNPVINVIRLKSYEALEGESFRIYSMLGELVLNGRVDNLINVEALPKGVYVFAMDNRPSVMFIKAE